MLDITEQVTMESVTAVVMDHHHLTTTAAAVSPLQQ